MGHNRAISRSWRRLEDAYREVYEAKTAGLLPQARDFVENRLAEGRKIAEFLSERFQSGKLDVLDVGSGNGAIALAVSTDLSNAVTGLDRQLNDDFLCLRSRTGIPAGQVVADGEALPLPAESFDVVLCLETLEHTPHPGVLGGEIMRVLRPGGFCLLTTPARLRHLLGPDPHFGVPGLLLLPDRLQKWTVTRLLKILPPETYDVVHVYWYSGSIARLFPGHEIFQALGPRDASRLWSLGQRLVWRGFLIHKTK
jgi:SAM-dependent methyltransferase